MTTTRIDRIRTLLKGIETGDPDAVKVISPTLYIQHNPQTQTGREGLAELFATPLEDLTASEYCARLRGRRLRVWSYRVRLCQSPDWLRGLPL